MSSYTPIEQITDGINNRVIIINAAVIKTYPKRWTMLMLSVLSSALINMQWIQYSVIADIISKYYNVSYEAVNWTSLVYSLLYIPMAIPGSYFLDKFGLRNAVLTSTMLACLGAWVKIFSIPQNMFWVVLLGQTIIATSAMFVVSTSAAIAATWFGSKEKSTACSIGIFGGELGVAIGFLIPSLVVTSDSNDATVGRNLFIMLLVIAVITTILFVAQLIFFEEQPWLPPSNSEVEKRCNKTPKINLCKILKQFVTHQSFMIHVISNSIGFGINIAVLALLNQILSCYYTDASIQTGRIGLITVLSGMLGTVLCGMVLDKYYQYKTQLLVIQFCSILVSILFTFALGSNIYIIYGVSALLGFFWSSIQPIGYETAIELIYPHSENLAVGFLSTTSQFSGIVMSPSDFRNRDTIGKRLRYSSRDGETLDFSRSTNPISKKNDDFVQPSKSTNNRQKTRRNICVKKLILQKIPELRWRLKCYSNQWNQKVQQPNRRLWNCRFGCRKVKLAKSTPHTLHCFDLVAVDETVTACDMAHVPLEDNSVNVVVFCLSLMGTNIKDYILEANSVMKNK
ncbi:hypothetical protein RN001_007503 [Aquatica leii]|uniref:Ribosomal RNA-processing protein 8 n=1 Tax=Aquatica leii TaxID=1421715 RepID=A0AAN7P8E6_9COLE|nr:hypothetical protein RN001_007503 [Aquatica leii]